MTKSLCDLLQNGPLAGATVAVRVDFNVPLASGRIADAARVERTVPSIVRLVAAGARVVLLSHLGRPGGRGVPELSLEPVSRCLAGCLDAPVGFVRHTAGLALHEAVAAMPPGTVSLVENTRFLPGETSNDPDLASDWASWADHFVLEAFGTAHRAHASTDGLPRAVRAKGGQAVAGGLVERELAVIAGAIENPGRPYLAILGGAKISGKIHVI